MKNIYNQVIIGFAIFSLVILSSCGSSKIITQVESGVLDTLSDEQVFEFKYNFFEANKYYLAGNYDMAVSIFNSCLKIDPYSAAVHYQLASIYALNKDFNMAEVHAEKAVQYNQSNIWYLYLAGNIYAQNNNMPKAKEVFNRLISIDSQELDFYLSLADLYIKNNDIEGALKVYNNIESIFGISESISLQKYKILMASNKPKDALNELKNLSKSKPESVEYKRMIADFYTQTNNIDEAIKSYKNILLEFNTDGYSHIGLAECYRKKGDFDNSFAEVKLAFASEDLPSDIKFNMLLSILQSSKDNERIQNEVFVLSEMLYNLYPSDADIATIYANNLLHVKKLAEAKTILEGVCAVRKDKYPVWEQLILLDNEFNDWEAMLAHSNEALQYFPNQSFLYFFNGFSAFQLNKFEQTIKSLSFGYKLITKNDPLVLDYLTFLGEASYKLNKKTEAYSYYDKILKLDPENIMVLNNYAYYLSEDNRELEKAEKMSKITITKEPNNATYLDTYAWILFKLNQNEKALSYMEKAIANDKEVSDVVLEHYGDILFHNNRPEEAIIQWKKALIIGEGSGLLETKIKNETYIE